MGLKLITAPADYPVTLEECRSHLEVDYTDKDTLIEMYLRAAVDEAEQFTGRSLVQQTWDYYLDGFPDDESAIEVPRPPLIEIGGVYYVDSAGDEQLLDTSVYRIDGSAEPARLSLGYGQSWPTLQAVSNAVRIRFTSGYIDDSSPSGEDVPPSIKAAILLTVGTMFASRENIVVGQSVAMLPWGAEQLLRNYRVHTAIA